MKPNKHHRLLPVKGAYNMRDLGGYRAADNKQVKWNTVIRSGDLNNLTNEDIEFLASLPLRTDIDFRGQKEKDAAPDKLPSTVKQYISLPLETGDMSSMIGNIKDFDASRLPTILKEIYVYIIQNAQETYSEFFRILEKENSAPLLFHCSAGKDRTGIGAALFLSALGVDRKTVMEDYMLSAEYIKGKYDYIVKAHPALEPITTVKKEYLEAAFQTIDTEYGGMENYLVKHLKADIPKLRYLYTE